MVLFDNLPSGVEINSFRLWATQNSRRFVGQGWDCVNGLKPLDDNLIIFAMQTEMNVIQNVRICIYFLMHGLFPYILSWILENCTMWCCAGCNGSTGPSQWPAWSGTAACRVCAPIHAPLEAAPFHGEGNALRLCWRRFLPGEKQRNLRKNHFEGKNASP